MWWLLFLVLAIPLRGNGPALFFKDGDSVVARSEAVQARFGVGRAILARHGASTEIEYVRAARVEPQVIERAAAKLNLITSHYRRTDIPLYSGALYVGLYPGVDLRWSGHGRSLKSEFLVAAGASHSSIRLRYPEVELREDGSLVSGPLVEQPPICWAGDSKRHVLCRYSKNDDGSVGFEVEGRHEHEPLVIDPAITYSTYVGGTGIDVATGVALDSSGNTYVCGYTDSPNFPLAGAAFAVQGGVDGFVLKFNAAGSQLLYATYVGGSSDDRVFGCTVDTSGQVYLAGATSSGNFPVVPVATSSLSGGRDAFVVKLSANGSQVLYSRLIGGSDADAANAIAVDSAGNAYVAGETSSINLPGTSGSYQPANKGRQDVLLAKLSSTGSLSSVTYLGGTADERALGVAVDASGAVYLAGGTTSSDFPVASAYQATNKGGQDCFITKFPASLATLTYSTYLGGAGGSTGSVEQCNAIAVNGLGNAYVAGSTPSTNFPLVNPLQTALSGGGSDGFVSKISATGTSLVYSTYFGTGGIDQLLAIAIDSGGQAYVAGKTSGSALPLADALQSNYAGGGYDGYIARIRAAGSSLDFSSYLGASGLDSANAIAVNQSGTVAVAGQTTSSNFPLSNAYQSFGASDGSAFVTVFTLAPPAVPAQAPSTGPGAQPSSTIEPRQKFVFQLSDPNGFQDIQIISVLTAATATTAPPTCHIYYNRPANLFYMYDDSNVPVGPVAPGSPGTLENSQCKLYAATSGAVGSVNTLTLTVDVERKAAYYGAKTVYVWLNDTTGRSAGLDAKAIWNITAQNQPPTTGPAANPSAITSARQTITFAPTDPNGFGDISIVSAVVSSSPAAPPGTCHAYYNRATNLFYLLSDSNQTLGPLSPASGNALQNSQCILYGQNSSATGTGTTLNIRFDLEMMASYSGQRNVYLWLNDNLNASAGLDLKGTWDIPAAPNVPPSTGPNATPNPVNGSRNVIRVVPSDGNGYQDIRVVSVLVHATASVQQNSCHVYLNRLTNLFYLYSDTNAPLGPATPGSATVLENSQCRFYAATSSVSGAGDNLTINADIERLPAYGGAKGVYVWLNDSKNAAAGLDLKATWTVP